MNNFNPSKTLKLKYLEEVYKYKKDIIDFLDTIESLKSFCRSTSIKRFVFENKVNDLFLKHKTLEVKLNKFNNDLLNLYMQKIEDTFDMVYFPKSLYISYKYNRYFDLSPINDLISFLTEETLVVIDMIRSIEDVFIYEILNGGVL